MQTAFSALDAAIIVAYLAVLTSVGVYFSRRQRSLDEYFLARQSMAWLPVGLSLMAALDSAIDYLMQPSSTIKYGLILLDRHLVVAVAVSVGRPRDAAVLPAAELLHGLRVSRGAVRRARAQPRRRHLHRLAPGLDGDGDLRAVPRDQRGDRRTDSAGADRLRARRASSRSIPRWAACRPSSGTT